MKKRLVIYLIALCLVLPSAYADPFTIAALIAGAIGASITLGGTIALGLVVAAVEVGIGIAATAIFSQKPPSQALPPSINTRAQAVVDNVTGTVEYIPVAYGFTKMGGLRVYVDVNKHNLYMVVVFSEGEIDSFVDIFIDDTISTDKKFKNLVTIYQQLGADDQEAVPEFVADAPGWTSSHRLAGTACLYIVCKKDANAFPKFPVITCTLRGKKILDPRNPSAPAAWSDNPSLCIYDYLQSKRYGKGLDTIDINSDSFSDGGNYCDTTVPGENGSGTQKRYRMNGYVDTSQTVQDNVSEMSRTCNGTVTFYGGQHRLLIFKPEVAAFHFDETNIIGAWSLEQQGSRFKKNQVEVSWLNPDTNWQGDLTIVTSASYLAEDDGHSLVQQVDLPYCTNHPQSHQTGQIALHQSRLSRQMKFKATLAALRVEIGQVVSISHKTPGYVNALFRVANITLEADASMTFTVEEYDDDVYVLEDVPTGHLGNTSTLGNPFQVDPPGVPLIAQRFVNDTAGNVQNAIDVSWSPPNSTGIAFYQVEYNPNDPVTGLQTAWIIAGDTRDKNFTIPDLASGMYDFQVKAINTFNVASEYAQTSIEIVDDLSIPGDITNFSAVTSNGQLVLSWDHEDSAHAGGKYRIKHSPVTTGASWEDLVNFTVNVSGKENSATLGLQNGTYMIKAVNVAGVESATEADYILNVPDSVLLSQVLNVQEDSAFSGTKTGMIVSGGHLKLDGTVLADSLSGNWDSLSGNWDSVGGGGTVLNGEYDFSNSVNLGGRFLISLLKTFQASYLDDTENWDTLTGNWDSQPGTFDGNTDTSGVSVKVYYRTTQTDPTGSPTWSAWQLLNAVDTVAWGVQFKLLAGVTFFYQNVDISALAVLVKMRNRSDVAGGLSVGSGGTSVTFTKPFYSTPVITAFIENPTQGDYIKLTSESVTGFTATVYNASSVAVSGRTIRYNAYGVGEKQ